MSRVETNLLKLRRRMLFEQKQSRRKPSENTSEINSTDILFRWSNGQSLFIWQSDRESRPEVEDKIARKAVAIAESREQEESQRHAETAAPVKNTQSLAV